MALPYIAPGAAVSEAQPNAIYDLAITRLTELLGGRTPALAFRLNIPARLTGKAFFFNDGVRPTPHSAKFHGYIPRSASVADPIYGANVNVTFARGYDHSPFTAAATALAELSRDNTEHSLVVADAGNSYYTNGLPRVTRTSLFDHSLCVHWRIHTPPGGEATRYYLRETSCFNPERIHRLAVAEIIIENLTELTLPADADGNIASKYCCLRFHNCSPYPCVTNLGTIPAYGCRTLRRDWNAATKAFTNYRWQDYFWRYEPSDVPFIFCTPHQPDTISILGLRSTLKASEAINENQFASTPHGALAANNLANTSVLYDWAVALAGADFARFDFDPAQVCDLAQFQDGDNKAIIARQWDCFEESGAFKPEANAASLIAHPGDWWRARVHRTEAHELVPTMKREDFTLFRFGGFARPLAELLVEFAAAGVALAATAEGPLRLSNNSADWELDLIQRTTNFLRKAGRPPSVVAVSADGDADARTFTNALFEGGPNSQNWNGLAAFTLSATAAYKILQRTVTPAAHSTLRQYVRPDGTLATLTSAGDPLISEIGHGANAPVGGLHAVSIEELLALKFFGNVNLAAQSDDHVTFDQSRLVLTPTGWRILFRETVRADVLPNLAAPDYLDTGYISPTFRRRYRFDEATGRWALNHAVHLRGHGFGYWHHGSQNVNFHSVAESRQTGAVFTNEVSGPDGADFTFTPATDNTNLRFLREVLPEEISISVGSKVFKCARLDSLPAFERNKATPAWYQIAPPLQPQPRAALQDGTRTVDSANNVNQFVRLSYEHVNALIECANQIVAAQPLGYRGLVFVQHTQVLEMGFGGGQGLDSWQTTFGGLPAPVDAFFSIQAGGLAAHWRALFASLGLVERDAADVNNLPPSVATWRTRWNQTAPLSATGRATLANIGFDGYIEVLRPDMALESQRRTSWRTWAGDVTVTVGEWTFGPTTDVNQGRAVIALGQMGASPATVNLAADYVGKKWFGFTDFKDWCASVGLVFEQAEMVTPLVLGWLRLNREVEAHDVGHTVPATRRMRLHAALAYNYSASNPNFPNPPASDLGTEVVMSVSPSGQGVVNADRPLHMLAVDGTTDCLRAAPQPNPFTLTHTLDVTRIAYRLAEKGEGAEFKLPVSAAAPADSWNFEARSAGRARMSFELAVAWGTTHTSAHPRYILARIDGPFSGFDALGRRVGGAPIYRHFDGLTSPLNEYPWSPSPQSQVVATFLQSWKIVVVQAARSVQPPYALTGVDVIQPVAGGSYGGTSSLGAFTQAFSHLATAVADLKTPEDAEAARDQDRYAAWIGGERHWPALHLVSTNPAATRQVVSVSRAAWGVEQDWWLASLPAYLQNLVAAAPSFLVGGAAETPWIVPGHAPRVPLAGGVAAAVGAPEGLTAVRPAGNQRAAVLH